MHTTEFKMIRRGKDKHSEGTDGKREVCMCVEVLDALCDEGTILWQQFVISVSVQYPHLNFVLLSNSLSVQNSRLEQPVQVTFHVFLQFSFWIRCHIYPSVNTSNCLLYD